MFQQRRTESGSTFADTRVGVYNIFLTTDKELAENFSKYSSFSILKTDIDRSSHDTVRALGKDSFGDKNKHRLDSSDKRSLCLLSSDLNIVNFTHEVNFAEGGGVAPVMKLKCVEPGLEVLKKLYFLLLGERISDIKYRKNELFRQSRLLDAAGYQALPVLEAEDDLQAHIRNNMNGQRVYIAYGVGDDLKYWGGPYSCILGQLEHSNDGRKESITYHFSPDHISRQFDEDPSDPGSDTVNFKTLSLPITAYRDVETGGLSKRELIEFEGYTPSFHDNVVKLISNYLYQLGITNHLVVLPNLDFILAPIAEQVIRSKGWLGDRRGTLINTDFESSQSLRRYLYDVVYQTQRIFGLQGEGVAKSASGWWIGDDAIDRTTTKDLLELQKDFLAKVGLRGNNTEEDASDIDPKLAVFEGEEEQNWFLKVMNSVDTGGGTGAPGAAFGTSLQGIDAMVNKNEPKLTINDPFSSAGQVEKANAILSLELPFEADSNALDVKKAELLKDGNFITHVEKFVQDVVNKNGGFVGRLSSFWENDVNVINAFKERWGSGTFVGYKDNVRVNRGVGQHTGAAENLKGSKLDISDDSFFIFGDEDLIRDYLYGEIVHKVSYSAENRSVFDQVRRGVPYSFAALPDNYFLDPFWSRLRGDIKPLFKAKTSKTLGEEAEKSKDHAHIGPSYASTLVDTYFSQIQSKLRKAGATPFGYFNDYNAPVTEMLPDEFSFLRKDINQDALDDIIELNIPFFLGNTKNSNVLSYTFDADNFIFAQFLGSINEIYYNMSYRYVKLGQKNPVFGGRPSSNQAFEKIYDVLDSVRKRGGAYGSRFKGLGLASPEVNLSHLSNDLTDILLMETPGLNRKVRKNYGTDTIALCHLFLNLFESQFKGIIKTLPMYNLSSYSTLLKPAIVSLKSTPGINIKPSSDRSTADFFSGLYKILGFKHTISNKKGHSEFTLVKDITSTLSNDK
jgi:hypothetical protein